MADTAASSGTIVVQVLDECAVLCRWPPPMHEGQPLQTEHALDVPLLQPGGGKLQPGLHLKNVSNNTVQILHQARRR